MKTLKENMKRFATKNLLNEGAVPISVQDILDIGQTPAGKTTGTYKIVQLKEPQVINGKTYNFELFLDDNVKLI